MSEMTLRVCEPVRKYEISPVVHLSPSAAVSSTELSAETVSWHKNQRQHTASEKAISRRVSSSSFYSCPDFRFTAAFSIQ